MSFNAGTILGHLKLDKGGFAAGMVEANGLTKVLGTSISSFLVNPLLGVASAVKSLAGGFIKFGFDLLKSSEAGRTLKKSLEEAMGKTLGPLLERIAPVLTSLVTTVAEALVPAFEALGPIIEALAPLLEIIAKIVGVIVTAIAKVVGWILGPLKGLKGLLGDSGGGGAGTTNVKVEVSPEDSARRVADKLAPTIAGNVAGLQHRIENSSRRRMELADYERGFSLR